jgi:bacteriocin-like protein
MKNMSNTEMQNIVGMMLVIVGLSVFVVLTQILDVIQ